MSRMLASRMGYEPERTATPGAVGATYSIIGTPFSHPIREITLQNNTNQTVSFSLDGVTTFITLQAGIAITLDICTNRTADPNGLTAPIGWACYVKYFSTQPTTGDGVFCSAVYGAGAESL